MQKTKLKRIASHFRPYHFDGKENDQEQVISHD